MKTIAKLSIFLLFIVVTACSKSDNSEPTPKIDGEWNLKYVNGSFTGASYYFQPGIVNWKFDPTNQTVTVENNNTDTNLNAIFPSGTYNYEILDSNPDVSCSQSIKIDGIEFGCLEITTDELNITQTYVDGFHVHLVRYSL